MSDQWGAARPQYDAGQRNRWEPGQFGEYVAPAVLEQLEQVEQQAGYAADPHLGAYAGAPYGGAPAKRTNRMAVAGVILSVLPLLGLVLSIIGLSKANVLEGAGRTAATIGIALSLVFAGAYGLGIYKLVNSPTADPACVAAESAELIMDRKVSADEAALSAAETDAEVGSGSGSGENAGSGAGADGVRAVLRAMAADLQTSEAALGKAAGETTNAGVRAGIQAVRDDLGRLIAEVERVQGGDASAMSDLEVVAGQLQVAGSAVDSLCGAGSGGS
jgi:hypothetical protein